MKAKNGSGLIFAVVLLFVILGMVITLSSITMLETKMNQKTKSSVGAFYNSESGVEWALNKIATSTATNIAGAFGAPGSGVSPAGADYKVYLLDKDGKVIANGALDLSEIKAVRSVGTQSAGGTADTQRAIEAAVAQSACGVYPAPCDVRLTTATHNGDFGGYQGLYAFVQDPIKGCGPAYHACDITEITRYAQLHSLPACPSGAFVNVGFSFVGSPIARPISDCKHWTYSGVENGPIWLNGVFEVANCSTSYPVLCCK